MFSTKVLGIYNDVLSFIMCKLCKKLHVLTVNYINCLNYFTYTLNTVSICSKVWFQTRFDFFFLLLPCFLNVAFEITVIL